MSGGCDRRAFLGIGSNLGDRPANCARAVAALSHASGLGLIAASSLYETAPWGKTDQPDFINQVVEIECGLAARALLNLCQNIERELGRTRSEPRGPRVIDLDILLLGDEVVQEADFEVPHPRMHERRFALAPLAEIAPHVRHPTLGRTASELLEALGSGGGTVRRLAPGERSGPHRIEVECHAGYRGEETPRAVRLGDRRLEVTEVLERWQTPDHRYFRLRLGDGGSCLLRHHVIDGGWELIQAST